jgi:hypothetical protein
VQNGLACPVSGVAMARRQRPACAGLCEAMSPRNSLNAKRYPKMARHFGWISEKNKGDCCVIMISDLNGVPVYVCKRCGGGNLCQVRNQRVNHLMRKRLTRPPVRVAMCLTSDDANALVSKLVAEIGLADLGAGSSLNFAPGTPHRYRHIIPPRLAQPIEKRSAYAFAPLPDKPAKAKPKWRGRGLLRFSPEVLRAWRASAET